MLEVEVRKDALLDDPDLRRPFSGVTKQAEAIRSFARRALDHARQARQHAWALGGVAGIITQLSIGWVVQNISFTPVFTVCALVYLLALTVVQWLTASWGRCGRSER